MLIATLGMSHRSAPVEVRETVAFPPCAGRAFLRRLKEENLAAEAVLLSTCNRTELYAVVEDEGAKYRLLDILADDRGVDRGALERDTYWLTDAEAVRHLYRVASSLDSMVVGEAQILGQVREAYRAATEDECTGPVLNRLFHTSLRVGKQVRTRTGIGDSSISVPHVAVKMAEDVFGTLEGRRALVVGAGEMSELVVKHLRGRGISELRIANRTTERARNLADRVGGNVVGFGSLSGELAEADVVVSSTGSGEWVIGSDDVAEALSGRTEPLFFIDIAVPRDVDPTVQTLGRAYLYDIDDLQAVVERNVEGREQAAAEGEALIQPEVFKFMGWLSTLHVAPLIKELQDDAERIRNHEVSRALNRMDLSPEEKETVEKLSHSLVNKLLHGPISEIKNRAGAGSPVESYEVRKRLPFLRDLEMELHRLQDSSEP